MSTYKKYKISLTDNQKSKIATALKKKTDVTIQITKGTYSFLLSERQINKIEKNYKDKKDVRITLTYNQLKENQKDGGILPLIFAGIGALGALASGASSIYSAVKDSKHKDKILEEQIRHNKAMETKKGGKIGKLKKKKNNSSIKF